MHAKSPARLKPSGSDREPQAGNSGSTSNNTYRERCTRRAADSSASGISWPASIQRRRFTSMKLLAIGSSVRVTKKARIASDQRPAVFQRSGRFQMSDQLGSTEECRRVAENAGLYGGLGPQPSPNSFSF